MATPQLPDIFLSHSGEQKGFVWSLYRELLHVNHNPFFDQDAGVDSLPKGISFVTRILQACRACKLAVVVLSHDYIESGWPMLELQQFFFHHPQPPYILPLFYKLKPADLSKEENLTRWRKAWQTLEASWKGRVQQMRTEDSGTSSSMSDFEPMLDIKSWPEALSRLRSQSGQTLPDNKDELPYIQDIVSNICKFLPPPQSFLMASSCKGGEHIQKKIDELFEQQQKGFHEADDSASGRMPICVGLHGVGGSGKSTVCNYMLSFYAKRYPGSCCFLQLPSDENRGQLVDSMKAILSQRGNLQAESLKAINSFEQALPHFHELLKRYRVFLVVDNIWDWAFLDVQQILATDFMQGSRLLVTARSRGLLEKLSSSLVDISDARGHLAIQIEHVPSISHAEAIEALKAYSASSRQDFGTRAEDLLGDIARSCFVEEQCHPLLLKVVGAKLRHIGGSSHGSQGLQTLLSCLQALKLRNDETIEKGIVSVLRTSYDALNTRLQDILLMLGTCVSKRYVGSSFPRLCEWLSMVLDGGSQSIESIREKMLELEYHGLIQIREGRGAVFIHDLHMAMIDNIVQENKDCPQCLFFQGDDVTTVSETKLRSLKFISTRKADGALFMTRTRELTILWKKMCDVFTLNCQRPAAPDILDVEVLHLLSERMSSPSAECRWVLNVGMMQFLRYLDLQSVDTVVRVTGWDGAPNLVSVKVCECESLRWIGSMSRVSSLKALEFQSLDRWQDTDCMLSTLFGCTALQMCKLKDNPYIRIFPSLTLFNLRELYLSRCHGLQSMEGSEGGLTALEVLDLEFCSSLKSIPDLKQLLKLRRLKLDGCSALEEVKLGEATLTSLEKLTLSRDHMHLSITGSTCSALPISAFSNLRDYALSGADHFDVGRISLPTSLEKLRLWHFKEAEAREMPDLSVLVNLKHLEILYWESLTSITGLGSLTKLENLKIWGCVALQEVEPCSSSNLECVKMSRCYKLERLPILGHLRSLRKFQMNSCPMVKKEMLPPQVLPALSPNDEDIEIFWEWGREYSDIV